MLRALRGGGGGNFGIVTTFEFKTHKWGQPFTDFSLGWTKDQLRDNALPNFIDNWVQRFTKGESIDRGLPLAALASPAVRVETVLRVEGGCRAADSWRVHHWRRAHRWRRVHL